MPTIKTNPELPDYALVILTNGFVYAGHPKISNGYIHITKAQNVRRSGTDRGFGQLALHGKRPETQLDPCPDVLAPLHSLVHLMQCSPL